MLGKKVLLIGDNSDFINSAGSVFENVGADVIIARDGMEGISNLFTFQPDLIAVHIPTPDHHGLIICRRFRDITDTPIIVFASMEDKDVFVKCLEAGADDFISIPFNPEIVLARSEAVLRSSDGHKPVAGVGYHYNDGNLDIDVEKHLVRVGGQTIRLTPIEFRLLVYLSRNPDRVLTTNDILKNVWGREYLGNFESVHVYVSHLRKKIENDARNPHYILTVHGIGYRFEIQSSIA